VSHHYSSSSTDAQVSTEFGKSYPPLRTINFEATFLVWLLLLLAGSHLWLSQINTSKWSTPFSGIYTLSPTMEVGGYESELRWGPGVPHLHRVFSLKREECCEELFAFPHTDLESEPLHHKILFARIQEVWSAIPLQIQLTGSNITADYNGHAILDPMNNGTRLSNPALSIDVLCCVTVRCVMLFGVGASLAGGRSIIQRALPKSRGS
jgi:hypothetical protein